MASEKQLSALQRSGGEGPGDGLLVTEEGAGGCGGLCFAAARSTPGGPEVCVVTAWGPGW